MSANEDKIPKVPLGFFANRRVYREDRQAEKNGEELSPEAIVWKMYVNEAEDYDRELVSVRNANLDTLLLFATLFSAVVTAFIIESKNLLQQDPSDASLALLLFIAQSQQRIELGRPSLSDSDSPSIPDFAPSNAARWVNGFWFTSLGLSISAALIAMLGKEWLDAFTVSRPRPTHSNVIVRQSRLEGLNRWWALHIIALLPSFLHGALLLFAVGLVIFLWMLDHAIAVVFVVVVAATSAFYVVTAIFGAIYEFCPFMTELSGYVRKFVIAIFGRGSARGGFVPPQSTIGDVQALLWLANHARDPTVTDYAYQALAGLHRPLDTSSTAGLSSAGLHHGLPYQLDNDTTLIALLSTLENRFERLVGGSLDPVADDITSAARYIDAILTISAHARQLRLLQIDNTVANSNVLNVVKITPKRGSFEMLELIETLWFSENMKIGPDAYARILVSTMSLILPLVAACSSYSALNDPTSLTSSKLDSSLSDRVHVIEFAKDAPPLEPTTNRQLAILRSHYSHWLLRVSYLLQLHSNKDEILDTDLVNQLLDCMTISARCDSLNPIDGYSTHHPPSDDSGLRVYRFVVQDPYHHDSPEILVDDLHRGPLGSLIELLRKTPGVKDGSPFQTCLSALQAYAALAPIILQQVLKLPRDELAEAFDLSKWSYAPQSEMKGLRYIATRQALLTVRYIGIAPKKSASYFRFCQNALGLLNFCIEQDGSYRFRKDTYLALAHHGSDLVPLLHFAGESESSHNMLSRRTKLWLLNAARVRTTSRGVTACDNSLTPGCFPPLLRMVGQTSIQTEYVDRLLQAMVRRMRVDGRRVKRQKHIPWNNIPAIEYLYPFTQSQEGFSALAHAGQRQACAKPVARAVADIVHMAAGQDPAVKIGVVEFDLEAVLGLLKVLPVAVRYLWEQQDEQERLIQLSTDTIAVLQSAVTNHESRELVQRHPSYADFLKTLVNLNKTQTVELPRGMKASVWSALKDIIGLDLDLETEGYPYRSAAAGDYYGAGPFKLEGYDDEPEESNFAPERHIPPSYPLVPPVVRDW